MTEKLKLYVVCALTWANLTKPYDHTHPTGRRHDPFDEAEFARTSSRSTRNARGLPSRASG